MLRISNLAGQTVWEQPVETRPGDNTYSLDLTYLPAGLYVVTARESVVEWSPVRFIKE